MQGVRRAQVGKSNGITRLVREEEECEGARRRAQQERRAARAAHQQAARREERRERARGREGDQRRDGKEGLELEGREEGEGAPQIGHLVLVQVARRGEDARQDGQPVAVAEEGRPAECKRAKRHRAEGGEGAEAGGWGGAAEGGGEEVAEECGREVEAHLLRVEREAECDAARERSSRHSGKRRPQREAKRDAVVLEVAMVDEEKSREGGEEHEHVEPPR